MQADYYFFLLCLLFVILGSFGSRINCIYEQYSRFINKRLIFKLLTSAACSFMASFLVSKIYHGLYQADAQHQMMGYVLVSMIGYCVYIAIMCCSAAIDSHAEKLPIAEPIADNYTNEKYFAVGIMLISAFYIFYFKQNVNMLHGLSLVIVCNTFFYILALRYFANKIVLNQIWRGFSMMNALKIAFFSYAYTLVFFWYFYPFVTEVSVFYIGLISCAIYYIGFILICLYGYVLLAVIRMVSRVMESVLSCKTAPYQGLIFTIVFPLLKSAVGLLVLMCFLSIDSIGYGVLLFEIFIFTLRYLLLMYIYAAFSNKSFKNILLCK